MAERVRMECPKCGYKCTPQWLNDAAHCLKCQAVLRRRAVGSTGRGVAVHEERRLLGEVSTFKAAPADARESEGGSCGRSPTGMHYWKFGKCNYCQASEPPRAGFARPTSAPASGRRGSIGSPVKVFDAGHKPQGGPDAAAVAVAEPREGGPGQSFSDSSTVRAATSTLGSTALGLGDSRDDSVAGGARPSSARSRASGSVSVGRPERTKIECPFCGYKCFPQWLNNEAHCLKCNKVVKTQPSIHGCGTWAGVAESAATLAKGISKRLPGEACTHKFWTPSSALESSSGECQASPDGLHHWRFGKCTYCQKGEGVFSKAGTMLNPGATAAACASGGKCTFKFAKCTKCGRNEY